MRHNNKCTANTMQWPKVAKHYHIACFVNVMEFGSGFKMYYLKNNE